MTSNSSIFRHTKQGQVPNFGIDIACIIAAYVEHPISVRGHSYFTDVLDITDCVSPSHVTVVDIMDGSH